jgi:hypothetical protein
MRTLSWVLGSIGFFAAILSARAAEAGSITSSATTVLSIDGVAVARVLQREGGDLRAGVSTAVSTIGGLSTKTVGTASVAPLVLHVQLPPTPGIAALVDELITGKLIRHTVHVTDYNLSGAAVATQELTGAILTHATFPAFDSASTTAGALTLIFRAENSTSVTAVANSAIPTIDVATSFYLGIDGLDTRGVIGIEPIAFRRVMSSSAIGETRDSGLSASSLQIDNLVIRINAAQSASWSSWWDEFVLRGQSGDSYEKSGSLHLVGASGKALTPWLNFSHLGILRVSRLSPPAGPAQTLEAELYLENVSLSTPDETMSAASAPSTASSDVSPSPVATTTEPGAIAAGPTASAPIATVLPGGTQTPLATSVPLASTTTAVQSSSVMIATSSSDSGSRDPAQFPRVSGLTREYYSGNYLPTYTNEQARYNTPEAIDALVARVDAAAKAAGWTLAMMNEATNAGSKTVGERWLKGPAAATLDFSQTTAGTQLQVQVHITLAPAN